MPTGTVVLVTRETLGTVAEKDREFGLLMMDKFLHSLESEPEKPVAICFYTEGARLVCRGSKVLLGLQLLQGLGVRIVACQSCLEHYGLAGEVAVGEVGNMKQIAGLMLAAAKVLTV
jgi:intracellular sulfur oxidation DsrE/DsrF family protein